MSNDLAAGYALAVLVLDQARRALAKEAMSYPEGDRRRGIERDAIHCETAIEILLTSPSMPKL